MKGDPSDIDVGLYSFFSCLVDVVRGLDLSLRFCQAKFKRKEIHPCECCQALDCWCLMSNTYTELYTTGNSCSMHKTCKNSNGTNRIFIVFNVLRIIPYAKMHCKLHDHCRNCRENAKIQMRIQLAHPSHTVPHSTTHTCISLRSFVNNSAEKPDSLSINNSACSSYVPLQPSLCAFARMSRWDISFFSPTLCILEPW